MESILFSLNAIAPIFLIVFLGTLLKKIRFADEKFFAVCDKVGFKICLPALLFIDIAFVDLSQSIDLTLILFSMGFTTLTFLLSALVVPLFLKDKATCGAFIQGACRSNSAILGVTLATNMFGDAGAATIASVLPFVVMLYNVYSVIVLNIFAPAEAKQSKSEMLKKVVKSIATNPLIIAIVLALLWQLAGFTMPLAFRRSLTYLADMSIPLALLSLGARFSFQSREAKPLCAALSSCVKTILLPTIATIFAYALGIRGIGLGIVLIIFGGPTAVSSYIMAKQMHSNHALAANIILISTLMSVFTLFIGILLLKQLQLI